MLSLSKMQLKTWLRLILLLGLPLYFTLFVDHFLDPSNLYAMGQSFAYVGLITLGLSVTMIAGEFDLSVAATATVAGLITVIVGADNAALGVLCAVAFGLAVGLANAALLPWLNVSSLLTTVGCMIFLIGLGFWLAGGRIISYGSFDPGDFLDQRLIWIFSPRLLLTLACYVGITLLLRYSTVGRDIYAAGSDRKAAIQSGANVRLALMTCFAISAVFASLAGGLLSLSLASAAASLSNDILLQAASAAIIGGVALAGGVGSAWGVAAGVLILAMLNNGLGLMNATSTEVVLLNGLLLLVVVLLDGRLAEWLVASRQRRKNRAAPGAGIP
jgi:ribose/xylose/arabinose/galactoside ABC-type transport system permease subunit